MEESAILEVPAQEIVTNPLPQKNNLKIILLVILGFVIVVGITYAAYIFGKKQTSPGQIISKPVVPTSVSEPTTTSTETADWKTYTNQKYKFSFQYPTSYQIYDPEGTSTPSGNFFVEGNPVSLTTLALPSNSFPNTNFSSAGISLWINDKTSETGCRQVVKQNQVVNLTETRQINGITFFSWWTGGTVPKAEYRNYVYRVFHQGICYEIDTYHEVTSIYDYPTNTRPQEVKEDEILAKFDQILSTFKFITPLSSASATNILYNVPVGWQTQTNISKTFQVSYDPTKYDANSPDNGSVNIIRKNLENNPYYSPYGHTTHFWISPYNNGSRHLLIEKELGEPISSANKLDSYKETEYVISGKKCLVIDGIDISQFPQTWGMCPINSSQALLITTFGHEYLIDFLKTLKFL